MCKLFATTVRPRYLGAFFCTVLLSLAGCGGGGSTSSSLSTSTGGSTDSGSTVPPGASALFHVDVTTGKVTITPASATSRTVFSGTAVSFNSSVLVDQPSTIGLKALSVSITNHWGLPIGQTPNGTTTGLKVLFGPFSNVTAFSDLRPKTNVATIAGIGSTGTLNGPASSASFNNPYGVAFSSGAIYIADMTNNRVRKLQNGYVSTFAGSGAIGGADGLGTAATFNSPYGIAVNPVDGALFVTDTASNRIRRITRDGRVTTIAGTGATGAGNGSGSIATFNGPAGIAIDSVGNIYVSDLQGNDIRTITLSGPSASAATSYTVSTLAGSGTAGTANGVGSGATFSAPASVTFDSTSGALFVVDQGSNLIRRVTLAGEVVTIAGTGASASSDGTGSVATFNLPRGILAVGGALFVCDRVGNRIRQLSLIAGSASPSSPSGWQVATLAGSGTTGKADGTGDVAQFNRPQFLAADGSGNLYVTDSNMEVRRVTPNGGYFPIGIAGGSTVTEPVQLSNPDGVIPNNTTGIDSPYINYAGSLASGAISAAKNWNFTVPAGVTAFEFAVTVEADSSTLTPPEGASGAGSANVVVRTLSGGAGHLGYLNGSLSEARFNGPEFLAEDAAGNIYTADQYNNSVRRISSGGIVSTVAGVTLSSGFSDGYGNTAQFSYLSGIAVTPDGNTIFVADTVNNRIRRVAFLGGDPTNPVNWYVTTIAGTGVAGGNYFTPTPGNTATLNSPTGICLSPGGNLYVSEYSGNRIRRIQYQGGDPSSSANWMVTLLAGNYSSVSPLGGDVDSANGSSATFNHPSQIACDLAGKVYVADQSNHRIRVATVDGAVTTLAGGVSGDVPSNTYVDGVGAAAHFQSPAGIAVDSSGLVYVSDSGGNHIRCVTQAGTVTTIAGTGASGALDGPGNVATFNNPASLMVTSSGTLYVGSVNDNGIRMIERLVKTGTQ